MTDHANTIRRLLDDLRFMDGNTEALAALDAYEAELRQAQEERDAWRQRYMAMAEEKAARAARMRDELLDPWMEQHAEVIDAQGLDAGSPEALSQAFVIALAERREAIDALREARLEAKGWQAEWTKVTKRERALRVAVKAARSFVDDDEWQANAAIALGEQP